ncbi:MAG: hypothetical protein CMP20_01845 [Rickettsiales bacterium]|nr:hypothetical protein [Rickettsiales bacterium]
MPPAAIAFDDGNTVEKIPHLQLKRIADLDVEDYSQAFFTDLSTDKDTVWSPKTCNEICAFLLKARNAASDQLSALKVLELEGDDYDCRQHLLQLRDLALLVKQLLDVIRILARCIVKQTSLYIKLVEVIPAS